MVHLCTHWQVKCAHAEAKHTRVEHMYVSKCACVFVCACLDRCYIRYTPERNDRLDADLIRLSALEPAIAMLQCSSGVLRICAPM